LEKIFSYLDLYSLKNARLVQKSWIGAASYQFSNKIICWHNPSTRCDSFELANFLLCYRLLFKLRVSLLDDPWNCDFTLYYLHWRNETRMKSHYKQSSNMEYGSELFNTFFKYSIVPFLTELRLEMALRDKGEVQLLAKILATVLHIRRLALDFTQVTNDAIQFGNKKILNSVWK